MYFSPLQDCLKQSLIPWKDIKGFIHDFFFFLFLLFITHSQMIYEETC